MQDARVVYCGFQDDPRATDNAWVETTVVHMHCPPELGSLLRLRPGKKVRRAVWVDLVSEKLPKKWIDQCECEPPNLPLTSGPKHDVVRPDHSARLWHVRASRPLLKPSLRPRRHLVHLGQRAHPDRAWRPRASARRVGSEGHCGVRPEQPRALEPPKCRPPHPAGVSRCADARSAGPRVQRGPHRLTLSARRGSRCGAEPRGNGVPWS